MCKKCHLGLVAFCLLALIVGTSSHVSAYRKFGLDCRDVNCAGHERCIVSHVACEKDQRDGEHCGLYPRCVERSVMADQQLIDTTSTTANTRAPIYSPITSTFELTNPKIIKPHTDLDSGFELLNQDTVIDPAKSHADQVQANVMVIVQDSTQRSQQNPYLNPYYNRQYMNQFCNPYYPFACNYRSSPYLPPVSRSMPNYPNGRAVSVPQMVAPTAPCYYNCYPRVPVNYPLGRSISPSSLTNNYLILKRSLQGFGNRREAGQMNNGMGGNGMNGNGMNGNGMGGNGMGIGGNGMGGGMGPRGNPMCGNQMGGRGGNGMNGNGMNGNGMNGNGMNGNGMNRNGMNGNGMNGNGMNGNGMNRNGMNGNGMNGNPLNRQKRNLKGFARHTYAAQQGSGMGNGNRMGGNGMGGNGMGGNGMGGNGMGGNGMGGNGMGGRGGNGGNGMGGPGGMCGNGIGMGMGYPMNGRGGNGMGPNGMGGNGMNGIGGNGMNGNGMSRNGMGSNGMGQMAGRGMGGQWNNNNQGQWPKNNNGNQYSAQMSTFANGHHGMQTSSYSINGQTHTNNWNNGQGLNLTSDFATEPNSVTVGYANDPNRSSPRPRRNNTDAMNNLF